MSTKIRDGLVSISDKNEVPLEIGGHILMYLSFKHPQALAMMTYFTQEMLVRGYLAGASICATIAYSDDLIDKFIDTSDKVFSDISLNIKKGTDFKDLLEGPIKHSGFQRLTNK